MFALLALLAVPARATEDPGALVWDAMEKTSEPKPGDGAAPFTFKVRNASAHAVTVLQVRPSCGCTVVDMPAAPWVLAPGAQGVVTATVDLKDKEGELTKSLFVESDAGRHTLLLHIKLPAFDESRRERNRALALTNRQAVLHDECALCHVVPGNGKRGGDLFTADCAICHVGPHRASMVPDLLVAREHRDAGFWRQWIAAGRAGTLMPAFAEKDGGPLTPEQIESLVEFALRNLPTEPPHQ